MNTPCGLAAARPGSTPTDSWVAGVVDPSPAPAVWPQAAPLVSALLQLGAAAAGGTEAVAAVPGQHGPSLSQHTWRPTTAALEQDGRLRRPADASSPASSSLSFSRSLFGVCGKEAASPRQRFRRSAASWSVWMANQAGGASERFLVSTPKKTSTVAGSRTRSLTASYPKRHSLDPTWEETIGTSSCVRFPSRRRHEQRQTPTPASLLTMGLRLENSR